MTEQLVWAVCDEHDETVAEHYRARSEQPAGIYDAYILQYLHGGPQFVMAAWFPNGEGRGEEIYKSITGMVSDAKAAAQERHNACGRAARWADYMRNNDPPALVPVLPPAGAGDPRDPATKDSNCRRCGSWTQWGWCPNCQPTEFKRLP